jgi:hypothetical protein
MRALILHDYPDKYTFKIIDMNEAQAIFHKRILYKIRNDQHYDSDGKARERALHYMRVIEKNVGKSEVYFIKEGGID